MNQIFILYHHYQNQWNSVDFKNKLTLLPLSMQANILKYRLWQDQQDRLIGKLLLREGLSRMGYPGALLELTKNKDGKPIIPSIPVSFNISHSGHIVICVLTNTSEIGIDIEKMHNVNIEDFKTQMTTSEWDNIDTATNKTEAFFKYWTQKEAVVKASGKGFSIPLNSFEISNDQVNINNEDFFLKEIILDKNYKCHIAFKEELDTTILEPLKVDQLHFKL